MEEGSRHPANHPWGLMTPGAPLKATPFSVFLHSSSVWRIANIKSFSHSLLSLRVIVGEPPADVADDALPTVETPLPRTLPSNYRRPDATATILTPLHDVVLPFQPHRR